MNVQTHFDTHPFSGGELAPLPLARRYDGEP